MIDVTAEDPRVPSAARRLAALCAGRDSALVRLTYAEADEGSTGPERGTCGECGSVLTVSADGGVRAHRARGGAEGRCAGSGAVPETVLPGEELPPVRSLAVRASWAGGRLVGVWNDGRYVLGVVRDVIRDADGVPVGVGPVSVGARALVGYARG